MGSREEAALFSSKTQRMQEEKTQEFLPRDLNADYGTRWRGNTADWASHFSHQDRRGRAPCYTFQVPDLNPPPPTEEQKEGVYQRDTEGDPGGATPGLMSHSPHLHLLGQL